MRVESAFLAEGVTSDIRGAMGLVGFNQRVLGANVLPFSFRQTLVVSLIHEAEAPDVTAAKPGLLTIQFLDPEGGLSFAATQAIPGQEHRNPSLPIFTNFAIELPLSGRLHGKYTLVVNWECDGEFQKLELPLLILSKEDLDSLTSVG
jgi:hypothetical protein